MKLLDLAHPLLHGGLAFLGDVALVVTARGMLATHHYNTSEVVIGTHVDSMFHSFADGRTLDQMLYRTRMLPVPAVAICTS